MNYGNILSELETTCPFPHLFERQSQVPMLGKQYDQKIAHIRADYAGDKWWNTIWPIHDQLATPEIRQEIDAVYDTLTSYIAFPNLEMLTAFCMSHPEAKASENSSDEFNFYLTGELCCYWLRCITRSKDYNLYLNTFLRSDASYQSYYTFLEKLRDSGKTNMYGAVPYLLEEYPKLKESCALHVLNSWMEHHEQKSGV